MESKGLGDSLHATATTYNSQGGAWQNLWGTPQREGGVTPVRQHHVTGILGIPQLHQGLAIGVIRSRLDPNSPGVNLWYVVRWIKMTSFMCPQAARCFQSFDQSRIGYLDVTPRQCNELSNKHTTVNVRVFLAHATDGAWFRHDICSVMRCTSRMVPSFC